MSGGALDYAYSKVEQAVDDILGMFEKYPDQKTELRFAFQEHLRLVAEALRAVEWNLSGDGDDREEELIRLVLGLCRTMKGTGHNEITS